MRLAAILPATAALAFFGATAGSAGEMKERLNLDASNAGLLRTGFTSYGYISQRSVVREADGFRFVLPANAPAAALAGASSSFTLSGDCEVSCTYELITIRPPRTGSGGGVGLGFDAGDELGTCSFQRVCRTTEESGYSLTTSPGRRGRVPEQSRFVPTTSRKGRLTLRRVKDQLIFLASDDSGTQPRELDRLPFTDETIRRIRFFGKSGGSSSALDVRVREIEIRADEITGGVPRGERAGPSWWWLTAVLPVAGAGLGLWRRRAAKTA